MALNTGFDNLVPNAATFSDWLEKTNRMIDLMRDEVITANTTIANTDGDARLHGAFVANTFHVVDCIYGGDLYANGALNTAELSICTNTQFTNNCLIVNIDNDLSVGGDLTVSGNTSLQYTEITELQVDVITSNTINATNLNVTNFALSGVGLNGNTSAVATSSLSLIDEFDKTLTKGFKYIIHGENAVTTSVYAVEIICGHNGTDVYYSRYGELSNNFNVTITPVIQGGTVQLTAICPSASASNTHTFKVVRIETI